MKTINLDLREDTYLLLRYEDFLFFIEIDEQNRFHLIPLKTICLRKFFTEMVRGKIEDIINGFPISENIDLIYCPNSKILGEVLLDEINNEDIIIIPFEDMENYNIVINVNLIHFSYTINLDYDDKKLQ